MSLLSLLYPLFHSLLLQTGHETYMLAKCNASRTSST
jgi:hypothetical protein